MGASGGVTYGHLRTRGMEPVEKIYLVTVDSYQYFVNKITMYDVVVEPMRMQSFTV
jgi:hypothetical protein